MTENRNIKKAILDYLIIETVENGRPLTLRGFCDEEGFGEDTVAQKVIEMYPALDYGMSPMSAWLWERNAVESFYDQWNEEPPEEIDECDFHR